MLSLNFTVSLSVYPTYPFPMTSGIGGLGEEDLGQINVNISLPSTAGSYGSCSLEGRKDMKEDSIRKSIYPGRSTQSE